MSKNVPKLRFPDNLKKHWENNVFRLAPFSPLAEGGRACPRRTRLNHRKSSEIIGNHWFPHCTPCLSAGRAGRRWARPWENYGFPETVKTHWKSNVSGMCPLSRLSAPRHTALDHHDSIERGIIGNLWLPLMVASWTRSDVFPAWGTNTVTEERCGTQLHCFSQPQYPAYNCIGRPLCCIYVVNNPILIYMYSPLVGISGTESDPRFLGCWRS